jgi:CBS domain containing-hemolysin-like protein
MVEISPEDSDFRRAIAVYLRHKLGIKVHKLSEAEFERACNITLKNFEGQTEAQIVSFMLFHANQERRARQTGIVLLMIWICTNVWMMAITPLSAILNWKLVVWIPASWFLVTCILGFVIAFFNHLAPSYIVIGNPGIFERCFANIWWWCKVVLVCLLVRFLFMWWFNLPK